MNRPPPLKSFDDNVLRKSDGVLDSAFPPLEGNGALGNRPESIMSLPGFFRTEPTEIPVVAMLRFTRLRADSRNGIAP